MPQPEYAFGVGADGILTVTFSENIKWPEGLTSGLRNLDAEEYFTIEYNQSEASLAELKSLSLLPVSLNWKYLSAEDETLKVTLNFSKPDQVSIARSEKDSISFSIKKPESFKGEISGKIPFTIQNELINVPK